MAALIPKTNATVGSATPPGAGALETGELAENKYTGRLYMETEAGNVVDPARVILTGDVTGSTATATSEGQAGTIQVTLGTVGVTKGGTGLTSTPSNGQIPIGNGTGFTLATLLAGSGVTITNGAGSITIAVSSGAGAVPTGTVIDFAGTTAPSGYLVCPTSTTNVSRTTYSALFAVIGTTYGAGDGSTTFGLPTYTADFAKIQANSNVGTATSGSVIAHSHTYLDANQAVNSTECGSTTYGNRYSATTNTSSTGGSNNIAAGRRMLFCIKF